MTNLLLAALTILGTGCDGSRPDPTELALTVAQAPGGGKKKNRLPTADPGGPYQTVDGTVVFDGSGSNDPDGPTNKLTYEWHFGDGASSTEPGPTHVYAQEDVYTVTLIVTDRHGAASEPAVTTATFEAENQPPIADPGGPYETTDGTVTFDGSASDDPDGANASLIYAWTFGDGATGSGVAPTHAYASPGTYDVTLVVTDELGLDSEPVATTATYTDDGGGGAVRTTTQAGNWSQSATWGGDPPPGDGDQAVVRHPVIVDVDATIGLHAPSGGTLDLEVQAGGTLQITTGLSLRVKGNIEYAGWIRVDEGASLLQDAPAGEVYTTNLKPNAGLSSVIEVRGQAGNPGVVDLNAGMGTGVLATLQLAGNGVLDFEHGIFRGGDAQNVNGVRVRNGQHYRLVDSRVESSAGIYQLSPVPSDGRVTVQNTTWIGTVTSEALRLNRWSDPTVPGITNFIHSVFDRTAFIEGPDALVDGCYLAEGLLTTAGSQVFERVVRNSLIRRTSSPFMNITGDYMDNIHLEHHNGNNPHAVQVNNNSIGSTISGNVFEYTGPSTVGDMIAPRSGNAAPISLQITGNVVLPNGDGSGPSGTLISLLGDELWTATVAGNTYVVLGSAGGIAIAETYSGHAGMVPSINSNLAVAMGTASGSVVHDVHPGIVDDYVTEADYNGYHDISSPYDAPAGAFASSPGANDVVADPMLVDPTRDLASYDLVNGGGGTVEGLIAEVARMNDPGFNPAYEPSAIRSWIRDGFRPTNPAFDGSGKDGKDIGAR